MNLGWLSAIASFGFSASDATPEQACLERHNGSVVDRESAGVYRTPQQKAKKVKSSKRNKAAKKARKRNRR